MSPLFCSLAVLDPRVGHVIDVLSPYISVLCHSDWLFHGESCPCLDVVHPGRLWSTSPACTWHCSFHYLFLQATPLFLVVWLALTVSSSSLFTPAMLRTHSFVFFAVHETRRIFLSPFVSNVTYTQWTVRDRQQSLTVCYTCCKLWLEIIAKNHANYAICCTCIMHSWTYNSSCNKVMWQWNCRCNINIKCTCKNDKSKDLPLNFLMSAFNLAKLDLLSRKTPEKLKLLIQY